MSGQVMLHRQYALSQNEWNDLLSSLQCYTQHNSESGYKECCELSTNIKTIFETSQGHKNKKEISLPKNSTDKT